MEYKTINFNSKQLNKSIPKLLLNLIEGESNIKIIPTTHWEIITYNLNNNILFKEYNNSKDLFKLIDTLLFIINYNFQSSKRMRKEIDVNYKKYIKVLKDIDIIIGKIPYDKENKKCNRYFTSDVDDRFTIIYFEDNDIKYNYNNNIDEVVDYNLDEFETFTLKNTKINIPLAILYNHNKIFNSDNYSLKMVMRLTSISRFIHNKRYTNKSKVCDRLFSSFTELSSESRKSLYLEINNKYHYFNELDMSNCAPTLLSNRISRDFNVNGDFLNDTGEGIFYEKLKDKIKESGEENNKWYNHEDKEYLYYKSRNDIKTMVCASILYGNNSNKILLDSFYSLYEQESMIINHMKEEEGKKNFANNNMKEEAKIFLNLEVPVYKFTTHDAIYFINIKNESIIREEIHKRMVQVFNKNVKYKLKGNPNDSDNLNINVDNNIEGYNIFIIEDKSRKKHKQHKQHSNNIQLVKSFIDKGITNRKELVEKTGLSLSTIKRIITKIKKEN